MDWRMEQQGMSTLDSKLHLGWGYRPESVVAVAATDVVGPVPHRAEPGDVLGFHASSRDVTRRVRNSENSPPSPSHAARERGWDQIPIVTQSRLSVVEPTLGYSDANPKDFQRTGREAGQSVGTVWSGTSKLEWEGDDFGGVTNHVVFTQCDSPLVDSLKVYANKMGDSNLAGYQTIRSESIYGSSNTSPGGVPKAKVAIVGNYYYGNPTNIVALQAPFDAGPPPTYLSLELRDFNGNPPFPAIAVDNPLLLYKAELFQDSSVWPLF